jgi:hypothetical protein
MAGPECIPFGVDGFEVIRLIHRCPEGPMTKSGREIVEISEAFDLTGKSVRNYHARDVSGGRRVPLRE